MHIYTYISSCGTPGRLAVHARSAPVTARRVHAHGSASSNVNASSVYEGTLRKEDSEASPSDITEKELSRREKISRANKGKVPWNKGKHMSEEMKAKISQRTYEAMQRPDVRERMKQANANRAPHSEEVRRRIREVLRKRAEEAKVVIQEQTRMIISALAASDDVEEREIALRRDAEDVIGKLAWRVLHRDFELMYGKWEDDVDGFRQAVKLRFKELNQRKARSRSVAKKKKVAGTVSKVGVAQVAPMGDESGEASGAGGNTRSRASTDTSVPLLSQAEEKLASVSAALTKLQGMKTMYKDDPDSLRLVEEKETQTAEMLERLQSQVELLRLTASDQDAHNVKAGSALPWSASRPAASRETP